MIFDIVEYMIMERTKPNEIRICRRLVFRLPDTPATAGLFVDVQRFLGKTGNASTVDLVGSNIAVYTV